MVGTQKRVDFGPNYAILHLDCTTLMCGIDDSPQGQSMVESCIKWNDAIHSIKEHRPLTIFTTLAFRKGSHELAPSSPFAKLVPQFGSFEEGSAMADEKDVVLSKTRWSATNGSNLEQILTAKGINTVVIVPGRAATVALVALLANSFQSGLSLSGVVMSTIYRLHDLDFDVFVIRDCVLELRVDRHEDMTRVMLDMVVPTMGLSVISLDEALEALGRGHQ